MHGLKGRMKMTKTKKASEPSITAELNREVANAVALYLNYKKYHWQVSGPNFRDLHLLFDEHASQVLSTIDELAERVQILGGTAVHHLDEIQRTTAVSPSEPGSQRSREMLAEALVGHEKVIAGMLKAIEMAADAGDPGTADLLTRFLQVHQKQAWFLRQTLA